MNSLKELYVDELKDLLSMLLESCLGIRVRPDEHVLEFSSPQLPANLDWMELKNLCVGKLAVDLRLQRNGDEISFGILQND